VEALTGVLGALKACVASRCLPGVAVVEVFLVLAAGVGLAGVALAPDALAGTALVVACCSSLEASATRRCLPFGLLDAAATGLVDTFLFWGRWVLPGFAVCVARAAVVCCSSSLEGASSSSLAWPRTRNATCEPHQRE
jgi:hypothetical protein